MRIEYFGVMCALSQAGRADVAMPYSGIQMALVPTVLKKLLPYGFKQRIKRWAGVPSMRSRLENLRRAGFECSGAVDVGAFAGDWAREAREVFGCKVLLAEPLPQMQEALRELARQHPFMVEPLALAEAPGIVRFRSEETNSRIAAPGESAAIEVRADRLDAVLARYPDFRPNLLKVDVQGSELSVLEGAGDRLAAFEVLVLEVSLIQMGIAPSFLEVMNWTAARGYRLYDILPMYYRPYDRALWQCDAFFARNDSALVSTNRWE
ncbi:FkbM family methyltransferase [Ramlibacter sp. PS4R-6]|uniref:FkbM family methyltransferase n=1 Tax=Ramlibacter sp. PS4R-6 TaxID=3133438 RepID=UPI0030B66C07